jgi:hypothetical protein
MSVTLRMFVPVSLLWLSANAVPSDCAFSPKSNGWKLVTGDEKKKLLESTWDCYMDGPRALQPITIRFSGDSGKFDAWQPNGKLGYTAKLLNIKAYRTLGGSFVILGNCQQPTLYGQFRWHVDQCLSRIEGTMWFTEPGSNFVRKLPGAHGRVIGKVKPK